MEVSEPFDVVDLIRQKREGDELVPAQIAWIVDAYARGVIADAQMAALAMAISFNGMTRAELTQWTAAMIASGRRWTISGIGRPSVDKHSTGGVGDKITLPLVPLVAACGAAVPQLAGRSLGHTGGTIDKLESISGWRADWSFEDVLCQLQDFGAAICAAGPELAPVDRQLYALRDVTGTIEAIPLIASSIMSKKLSAGASALVLDVKVGTGAFMKDERDARELAIAMVELGRDADVDTVALLTDMDTPLGLTIGNALEVREALEVLGGGGPEDVVELTLTLAREMLGSVDIDGVDPADALRDGSAMDVWRRMITAQEGDPSAPLPVAREHHTVLAPRTGVIRRLDAYELGVAARRLGAGRARPEDSVQPGAGIELHVQLGDRVTRGQPLLTLHSDEEARFDRALACVAAGCEVSSDADPPQERPRVLQRIAESTLR